MVLFKNKVINKIPSLTIGDGKLKPKFSISGWIKGLKDFGFNITIRWR